MKYLLAFDIGLKNLSYCLCEKYSKKIMDWRVIDLSKKRRCKYTGKFDMISCCMNINEELTQIVERFMYDDYVEILIENQIPTGSNGIVMKSIQGLITQFFIDNECNDITYISGSQKLKHHICEKKTYYQRKKSCVIICNQFLEERGEIEWIEYFNNEPKKDDLADCYLMIFV